MGQLALGLRSLAFKAAVLFVLAVLLAWSLGGSLWPRPVVVDYPPVEFSGSQWNLRLSVGGDHPKEARWHLMASADDELQPVDGEWSDATGPVVASGHLYVAAHPIGENSWLLISFDPARSRVVETLPDRLAVEQRLAQLRQSP
jgi:hypothetical protein